MRPPTPTRGRARPGSTSASESSPDKANRGSDTRAIPRLIGVSVLAFVCVAGLRGADEKPALTDLLKHAGERVRQFETDFALVVSDEDYRQLAKGRFYVSSQSRRTQSEMVFMWLPDEGGWLTVRNVLTADGKRVPDSQHRLDDALRDTSADRLVRLKKLLNESARFNVGRIFRNFNYPTLALSYLDPLLQPRFEFTLAGRERVNGVETWKVAYEERARPTVIQQTATPTSLLGVDQVSHGAVWIAENGIVHKTLLEVRIAGRETLAAIEVSYTRDDKLEMWVPARMHETYLQTRGTTINENIDCVARYSNFRRFETSGRIISPKELSP